MLRDDEEPLSLFHLCYQACSKKYQLDHHTCEDTRGLINEFLTHLCNLRVKGKNQTLTGLLCDLWLELHHIVV